MFGSPQESGGRRGKGPVGQMLGRDGVYEPGSNLAVGIFLKPFGNEVQDGKVVPARFFGPMLFWDRWNTHDRVR